MQAASSKDPSSPLGAESRTEVSNLGDQLFRRKFPLWLGILVFTIVHFTASLCVEWFRPVGSLMPFVDFPVGVLLAALCASKLSRWPFYILLALLYRTLAGLVFGVAPLQALGLASLECVSVALGVSLSLLLPSSGGYSEFRRLLSVGIGGVLLGPLASGLLLELLGPWLSQAGATPDFTAFTLSVALGSLSIAPFAVAWAEGLQAEWRTRVDGRMLEALAFAFAAPLCAWLAALLLPVEPLLAGLCLVAPVMLCSIRLGMPGVAFAGIIMLVVLSSRVLFAPTASWLLSLQAFCLAVFGAGYLSSSWIDGMQLAAHRLMGLHASITELVLSCELVRDAKGMPSDYRILDANPAFCLMTGLSREQAVGELASQLFGGYKPPHLRNLHGMMRTGLPVAFDAFLPRARRHLKVNAFPIGWRNRFMVVATDVTQILEHEAELVRSNRMYSVLSQINHSVTRALTPASLLEGVCQAFVEQGGITAARAFINTHGLQDLRIEASAGSPEAFLAEISALVAKGEGTAMCEISMREGRILVCTDFHMDPIARTWGESAARHGLKAAASFPLKLGGGVVGAVCLYSKEVGAFSTREFSLFNAAADDISHALEGIQREVARLRAISELQDSEHRFRSLFEQSPIAYLCLDPQGVLVDANPAWIKLMGGTRTDFIGHAFTDFLVPAARRLFLESFGELAKAGGESSFELPLQGQGGESLVSLLAIRMETDTNGRPRAGHCMVFDITERQRFEDAVRVSEQRLTHAFEIANDGIWELDLRSGKSYFSQRFNSLLGHETGDQIGSLSQWKEHVHPEDLPGFEASLEGFLQSSAEEMSVEYRIRHRQGHWLWMLTRGRSVERDLDGSHLRVIGTNSNITERHEAEESLRQTAVLYRSYIGDSPIPVLILGEEARILEANRAALGTFGQGAEEMLSLRFTDLMEVSAAEAGRNLLRSLALGGRAEGELRGRRKNGSTLHLAIQAVTIPSGRALVFCQDITARRRTEQALQSRESMLESILHTALDGFWIVDVKGRLIEVNESYSRASGYSHKELLQLRISDLEMVESPALIEQHIDRLRRNGSERWETAHRRKDGSVLDVEVSATYMPLEGGRIVVFIQDITHRKRAETALRQSQRRLALIIEGSALASWDWNLKTDEVVYNSHMARLIGLGSEDGSLGRPAWLNLVHGDDRGAVEEAMRQHLEGRVPYFDSEYRIRHCDGRWLWVLDRGQVIARDAAGLPLRATGTQRDVTARRIAQDRVRQQAALLDQTQDLVLATDISGNVRYCNRSVEHFLGRDAASIEGSPLASLLTETEPVVGEELLRTVVSRGDWRGEIRFLSPTRMGCIWDTRWVLVRSEQGQPETILLSASDVSEKRMLESRFLRSQRMESIGALATGVAHDLNNIFLPITLAANMLKQNPPEEQKASLHAMLDLSAQRGADVVRQLLTFSRGLDGRRIELQPRMIIHEIRRIVTETFPKNISLDCQMADDLWTILADPTQIHQVLLNLCVNARDAMPQGGTLTILAENVVFDEYYATMNPEAEAGPYIVLQVGDNGVGISTENQEKIFDPFFTTKPPGQGTGLGLSTVHGIVKGHRGFIQVRSQPLLGAQFKVYLPAIPSYVEVHDEGPEAEVLPGNGETILIVDDEEAVRESLRHLLETNNYRVITAVDGREGMVCFVQQREAIRAIVTDIMMPVMDGVELTRAVRRIAPGLPIIGMSGLPEKEGAASVPGAQTNSFLVKPFVSDQLLSLLRSSLQAAAIPLQSAKTIVQP